MSATSSVYSNQEKWIVKKESSKDVSSGQRVSKLAKAGEASGVPYRPLEASPSESKTMSPDTSGDDGQESKDTDKIHGDGSISATEGKNTAESLARNDIPHVDLSSEASTAEPEDSATSESECVENNAAILRPEPRLRISRVSAKHPAVKRDPIEQELDAMVRRIEPDNARQNLCRDAVNEIKLLSDQFFSTPKYVAKMQEEDSHYVGVFKVTPYGSYRQRTNIMESDLDLVIVLTCGASSRDVYLSHLAHFRQKLLDGVPHLEFVSLIPAKIPVLKLVYRNHNDTLDIDITMAKPCEHHFYRRDNIVLDSLFDHKRLTNFVRILKHWTKENRVNNAADGSLNSTSWVFLILTYLRHLGLAHAESYYYKDLLVGFFSFVCSVGEISPACVDVQHGRVSYAWFDPTASLVIQDPSTGHNCAAALSPQCWQYILALCRQAGNAVYGQENEFGARLDHEELANVQRRMFGPFPNMPPFPPSPNHDGCMIADDGGDFQHPIRRFNCSALQCDDALKGGNEETTSTSVADTEPPSTEAETETPTESEASDSEDTELKQDLMAADGRRNTRVETSVES